MVQSSWAIGYAAAALVAGIMLRYTNWRAVFFVGILPALVTLWIRKDVPESELWKEGVKKQRSAGISELFSPTYRKPTIALLFLNLFGLFGWWGLFTWIPPYLSLPVEQGGRGFGIMSTTTLLVTLNLLGMFPGYLSFGFAADFFGRKKAFILYLVLAAAVVPIYALARTQAALLVLGIAVAFFGTGFFSGSGLIGSEIFPTAFRARALGLTYNGARALSSLAPFVIGRFGESHGLSGAFLLCAASFLLAALVALLLPETRGKSLG
jgi:MFS family permease